MNLVSIRQMKSADSHAINVLKIPEKILMLNAAKALADTVSSRTSVAESKIAVFCGPGNNGGDGWAVASILADMGADIKIISKQVPSPGGSAGHYAAIALEKGVPLFENISQNELESCDLIIDALFGTGLSREISGIYLEYIDRINNANCLKVSADVPSGLCGDDGIPNPVAVNADITVCFGRSKASLFSEPGFLYAGEVITDDISIPDTSYEQSSFFTTDIKFAKGIIKRRKKTAFKGNYGKILIAAGSPGMTGAAALCADSCFRSGAGLVYTVVPESKKYEYDALIRETISIPVYDGGLEYISNRSADEIVKASIGKTVMIIGPGLHEKSRSHEIFRAVAKATDIPIIIDARTLNHISKDTHLLKLAKGRTIVTPHPGEMAELTGKSVNEIQKARIKTSMEFALEYDTIVLLKGHKTLVTDGKRVYLNTTGNPGMATAGSGDVLCGVIAASLSYAPSLLEATAIGAYIHGMAGDRAAEKIGEYGMKSGDIISELPDVMKTITGEI